MLHKLWLAKRLDRAPEKQRRDRHQAEAVHLLLVRHLPQYPLDDAFAAGLPGDLRQMLDQLPPIHDHEQPYGLVAEP